MNMIEQGGFENQDRDPGQKLLDYFAPMVVVNDVIGAFPYGMTSEGMQGDAALAARALMMPVKAAYIPSEYENIMAGQHEYLASIGIGPKEVRFVHLAEGETLFEAAMRDIEVRGEKSEQSPLTLYGQSKRIQKTFEDRAQTILTEATDSLSVSATVRQLKSEQGLATLRTSGTTEGVANNKLFLRTILAKRLGDDGKAPSSLNVDFVPVTRGQDINDPMWESSVETLLAKENKHSVLVKPTHWDSGDLIRFCSSLQEVKSYIEEVRQKYRDEYPDIQPDFVVEEDLSSERDTELSAQFLVDKQGRATFLRSTKNLMESNRAKSVLRWRGNIVGGTPEDSMNTAFTKDIPRLTQIAEYYAKLGYRGYLGFDLMRLKSGDIKVLEMNGRVTAATGPVLILEQLTKRQGTPEMVVAYIQQVSPSLTANIKSFQELKNALGDLVYDNSKSAGVIPALVTKLPSQFGAIIVAKDIQEAREMQQRLYNRLGVQDTLEL